MISHQDHMLATDLRSAEIGNPDARKRSGKRKQNKQMEKFKELSIEEMQEVDGGYWKVIYEAIKSGVIYDGIKAGVNFLLENPTERPEWLKHKMGGL